MNRIAGLTGGIATGKSTVCGYFEAAGAKIVDADEAAKHAVRKDQPAWREVVDAFGREILGPDGELDRRKLGDIVFRDAEKRETLNRIVHPRVYETMQGRAAEIRKADPEALIIHDIPLLFETGRDGDLSPVIVVYAPESVQLARLMQRNNLDREAAEARIRAQMPIEEKRRRADYIIDNGGAPEATRRQVEELHQRLVAAK